MKPGKYFTLCFVLFLLWWEEHASGRPTTTVTPSQSITDSVTTKIMDTAQVEPGKTNAQENIEDEKFSDSKEMGLESEKMNSQMNQTIHPSQADEYDLKELTNGTGELSDDSYYEMLHGEFYYNYENYDNYNYDYNGHEENALHKTKQRNNYRDLKKSESQRDNDGLEKLSKDSLKPRYKKNDESSSSIDPSREMFQEAFMVQKRNGETTEHTNLPVHHSVHHETDVEIGDGHVPEFNIDGPDAGSVDLHSGERHRFPEDIGPSHFAQSRDNPDESEIFTTQSISSDIDENGREELQSLPDDLIHTNTNPSNLDHIIDILSGDHNNQQHFTTNIPLSTDTSTRSSADNINTSGISNATSTGPGAISANEVVSENVSNSSEHSTSGQNVPIIIDQTGGHAVLFEDNTNEIEKFTNRPPNINQNGTQSNLNDTLVNDHNALSSSHSFEINPTQAITEAHTTFYGENTASSSILDISSSVHHSFGSSMSTDQSLQPSITYSNVQVSNTLSENSQFQTSTLLTGNRAATETLIINYITESETSHIVTTPDYGAWTVTSLMAEGPSATINPSETTTFISQGQTLAVTDRETSISEPTMKPDEKENITNRPGAMAPESTTDNPTSLQSTITSQHLTNRNVSMYSLTSASGNYHTTDSTERSPLPPSSSRTSTTTTPSSVPTTASFSSFGREITTDTVTLSTAQTESRVVNPPLVTSAVPPEIFTVLTTLQSTTTDRTVPDEITAPSLITEEVPNGTETKLPSTRHTPSNNVPPSVTSPNMQTAVPTNPSLYTPSTSLHQSTDHTVLLTSADDSRLRVSTVKPHIPNVPSSTSTSSATSMSPETSEPPPSFVELTFAMSWPAFCNHAGSIKGELVEICRHEAGRAEITEDQIQLMNKLDQECSTVNVAETEEISDEITVRMYFTNKTHHYDQELTIVCAEILESSSNLVLRDRSIIRDKLLYVRYNDSRSRGPVTGASTGDDSRVEEVDPNSSSDDPGVTIAVSLAVLGGCCCAGLIALQVVIRKRNQQSVSLRPSLNRSFSVTSADSIQLSSVTKSRPNSGVFNPGLDLSDPMDPTHPLNYTQLANFCVNESKIEEEFQKIPNRMPRLSVVPAGEEDKNRYANILPLTHTRVKLLQEGPNPRSSYINASYVTGPDNQCQYYIATQAPVEETISDFWTMVWQQNAKAIVMLTQMEEEGQVKCASYWPELVGKSAAQKFGDFLIELKQKDVHQEYIAHKLEINNLRKIEKRQIDHFWYTCWPPHGVPEPISLVKLVLDTRPKYEDSGTPLVVHCSPGIGRSCTFIALDLCMRQFETRRIVDVMKTVHVMRQERAGAIQNKEQYQLLYHAINEYATIVISPVVSAASSATTLHALLPS